MAAMMIGHTLNRESVIAHRTTRIGKPDLKYLQFSYADEAKAS